MTLKYSVLPPYQLDSTLIDISSFAKLSDQARRLSPAIRARVEHVIAGAYENANDTIFDEGAPLHEWRNVFDGTVGSYALDVLGHRYPETPEHHLDHRALRWFAKRGYTA